MKKMIVMQGIPGSGKSTLIKYLTEGETDYIVHSTDDYRFIEDVYVFRPEDNAKFHTMNQKACIESMQADIPVIIIDNTNITQWQAAPYFMLARIFGYDVDIERVECEPDIAIMRQEARPEHRRVPAHVIRSMHEQMETLDASA